MTHSKKTRLDAWLLAYESEVLELPADQVGSADEIADSAARVRAIVQAALLASRSAAAASGATAAPRRQRSGRRSMQPPQGAAMGSRIQTERLRATFGLEADSADPGADIPGRGEDDSTD